MRLSLGTDSELLAREKAEPTRQLLIAKWEAAQHGNAGDADAYQAAIVQLCRASGFDYLPAIQLAASPLAPLIDRIDAVGDADPIEADALMGGGGAVEIPVSGLLQVFEDLVKANLVSKDAKQMKKWRNDRELVLSDFVSVCGDLDVRSITREHVSKYRCNLSERLPAREIVKNTANRRILAFGRMVNDVVWDRFDDEVTVFRDMGWREPARKRRNTQVSYSREFVTATVLAPGALDQLNVGARDLLLVALNTGAGPSELVNLNSATNHLGDDVPHIEIGVFP
ncbi:MAG: hypothetical protein AAGP08_14170 [Pseudomonadota bacterium]